MAMQQFLEQAQIDHAPAAAVVAARLPEGFALLAAEPDEAFVLALLDEAGVATVHGAAFCFPGYIRISYANSTEELREACTRIQRFCEGLH